MDNFELFVEKINKECSHIFLRTENIITTTNSPVRFATQNKPNKKNGFYFCEYGEARSFCVVGDMRTGERVTIIPDKSHSEKKLASSFFIGEREKVYQQKMFEEEAERLQKIEEVQSYWKDDLIDAVPEDFPYIVRKKININNLKYDEDIRAIVVPIFNQVGDVVGVQRIYADGRKMFSKGTKFNESFGFIGFNPEYFVNQTKLYVCEGYATGNSIWQATNTPVVLAFDCNKLERTVENIRKYNPIAEIIICADNDHHLLDNVGILHAKKTADRFSCQLKIPEFKELVAGQTDFNDIHCTEGLKEVRNQLVSSIKIDMKEIEEDYLEDVDYIIKSKEFTTSKYDSFCHSSTPKILLNPPKNIDKILDFIVDRSPYPQILLSVLNILSVVGTIAGHRVRLVDNRGDLRTNFYSIGILPSTFGKDGSRKVFDKIKVELNLDYIFATGVKSDAAIVKGLKEGNGRLIIMKDEIGDFFGSMKKNVSTFQANIFPLMKELFTSSTTRYVGEKKKMEDDIVIDQPVLGVYGVTTEDRFVDGLSAESTADGFLGRFVVVRPEPLKKENDVGKRYGDVDEIPHGIAQYFLGINEMSINCLNNDSKNVTLDKNGHVAIKPNSATMTDEALKMLKEYELFIKKEQERFVLEGKESLSSICGRSIEKVKRIALISCINPTSKNQVIGVEEIRYAIALVRFSDKYLYSITEFAICNTMFQRNCKEIQKLIRDYCYRNQKMISKSQISELLDNKIADKDIEVCLTSLANSGKIQKEIVENKNYFKPILTKTKTTDIL